MNFYQTEEKNHIRLIANWVVDLVVVAVLAVYTAYSFGGRVTVNGHSMQPFLETGDVVLINRLVYDFTGPDRFDVAVFEREDMGASVKRVIGLPGETVQIKENQIYIDGEPLDAKRELSRVVIAGAAEYPVELGEDEYFLLGDNRDSSEDSRFSNVGNVKREQLIGKVWLRILPVTKLKLIRS